MRTIFVATFTAWLSVSAAQAQQFALENPQPGADMSGISLVSGWLCNTVGPVLVQFDDRVPEPAAYGTSRPDTVGVCHDENNGFGLLFNFNRLGDGPHVVRIITNGKTIEETSFNVNTFGQEFLRDAHKTVTVFNFPNPGQEAILVWSEAQQNFVVHAGSGQGPLTGPTCGVTKQFSLQDSRAAASVTGTVNCATKRLEMHVETTALSFFLCQIDFEVVQNGVTFDSIDLDVNYTSNGKSVCDRIAERSSVDIYLVPDADSLLRINQPFTLRHEGQGVVSFP